MSAAVSALRVEAGAREAMAETYEEEGNEEAVQAERARAPYLSELAEQLERAALISLIYTEADIRDYAEQAGVEEELALRRAQEWARHIQDTAARLCAEQLLSVVGSGQP